MYVCLPILLNNMPLFAFKIFRFPFFMWNFISYIKICISIVLLIDSADLLSQELVRLGVNEGLSQGFVTSVVQDRSGYIWVGTLNGLNRYNGYDFKIYRSSRDKQNSLLSNNIKSLTTDNTGRLWIYCQGMLQYYDEANDEFVTHRDINREINSIKESVFIFDKDRLLLLNSDTLCDLRLLTGPDGLLVEAVNRFQFPSNELGTPYCSFLQGGKLWIGTSSGVCLWNGRSFRKYFPEIRNSVQDIWVDSGRDILYIKTATDLSGYQNDRRVCHFVFESSSYAIRLERDNSQNQQILVWGEAIWSLNGTERSKTSMVFDKDITAVFTDRQGNVWVGLDASGLVCFQNREKKIRKVLNRGYNAGKPPLQDGSGGVWLNQKKGRGILSPGDFGEYRWSGLTGEANQIQPAVFSSFYADSDKSGAIWSVGESLGLEELKSGRDYSGLGGITRFNVDFGVNCLEDGTLLLISHDANRIVFCNPVNQSVIPVPDLRPFLNTTWWNISSVCKSTAVSPWIWFTGPNGIAGLKPDWTTGKCEIRTFDKSLLPDEISGTTRFIFARSDTFDGTQVWIGTWDGLFLWNINDNSLQTVSISQVVANPVFCMARTERNILWLGTQQGLVRYNQENGFSKIFTEADGLPAAEFNRNTAAVMPDGMIVMGTVNGTVCFYPEEMAVYEKPALMVISDVRQGNNTLQLFRRDVGYIINRLPYGSDHLMVQFSLLDFANMKTAQYRFRFSGGSNEWVSNGLNNTITLAGLTSGRHLLEIQGCLDGSEWSESQFLYIEVANPWWISWWAVTLLFVLIAGPAILIIRNRRLLNREKHRNELLRLESEHEAVLMSTKERILTNVAHDLRTPLTLITGLAEKIGGDTDEKIVKVAETIKIQSQELLGMIGQILNLGRIRELGGIPLSPVPLKLDQFMEALIELPAFHAREKKIRLTTSLPGDLPLIFLDENGLRAILGNLLSNAIKFTPEGGSVAIEVYQTSAELVILVRDSGPGIPPDKVKFLFQRYYQIDGEKYPGGSGVGLSYAAEMAELMGGQLSWVPPALGTVTGAIFRVSFPSEKLEVPASFVSLQRVQPDESQSKGIIKNDQLPLILVVEDQFEMADYIRSVLEGFYNVVVVTDGQSGYETTLELIPDLVISDVLMPGISGLDMCRAIREDIRTSHIPVILLSAKTSDVAIRAGLASGASLYLTKPFNHEVLRKYVENSLQLSLQTKRYFEAFWGGEKSDNPKAVLPDGISTEKEDLFIREVEALIAANYSDENFTVDKLASGLHISLSQLRRKIIALGGDSAGVMLRNYRLAQAKEMLVRMPEASISEVAFNCGFSDPNYFSSLFGKEFGITPRHYRISFHER